MLTLYLIGCALQLLALLLAIHDLFKRRRHVRQFDSWTTPVTKELITTWKTSAGETSRSLFGRRWRKLEARLTESESDARLATQQVALDLKNNTDLIQRVSEHHTAVLRQIMTVDKQAVAAVVLGVVGFGLSAVGGAPLE